MELKIRDFIKNENNCSGSFAEAVLSMEDGDTLLLEGGTYHFYPDGAYRKECYVSNNDSGEKPIALPVLNKKNITVDGGGAELIFHGMMMPILCEASENITLKNLSIDYSTPFYAQAKILSASPQGILIQFDGKEFNCRVQHGNLCFYSPCDGWEIETERTLALEFDKEGHPSPYSKVYFSYTGKEVDHGFQTSLYQNIIPEQQDENLIFMRGSIGERHSAGNYLIMTYAGRKCPGILITDSKDVSLEHINLYHTAAMGIIAQKTENVSLKRILAEPRKDSGRFLSTTADATHFVNCRGKISLEHCKFVQMMDDAANIHGIYHLYTEKHADGSLKLNIGHPQQEGIQIYRKGDSVAVIDGERNETKTVGTVLDAQLISPTEIRLKLDCDVPPPSTNWITENLSTAPEAHFFGCESGYNRPRGFLISTAGKVLVEKCKFYNMSSGIQLSGEAKGWYESGRVTDVEIRDCDFHNSAYAGGVAIKCKPSLWCTDTVFNRKIAIENNVFTQSTRRICAIESCEDVIFRNNTFHLASDLPRHAMHGEDGTTFENCTHLTKEELLT